MEVNTANNKMSLSMLPPTEEAGELPWSTHYCFCEVLCRACFPRFCVFAFVLGVSCFVTGLRGQDIG